MLLLEPLFLLHSQHARLHLVPASHLQRSYSETVSQLITAAARIAETYINIMSPISWTENTWFRSMNHKWSRKWSDRCFGLASKLIGSYVQQNLWRYCAMQHLQPSKASKFWAITLRLRPNFAMDNVVHCHRANNNDKAKTKTKPTTMKIEAQIDGNWPSPRTSGTSEALPTSGLEGAEAWMLPSSSYVFSGPLVSPLALNPLMPILDCAKPCAPLLSQLLSLNPEFPSSFLVAKLAEDKHLWAETAIHDPEDPEVTGEIEDSTFCSNLVPALLNI